MTAQTTFIESLENLTGFNEDAIQNRFGYKPADLVGEAPLLRATRALIFAEHLRNGMDEDAAYETSMLLSNREVGDYFHEEEVDEDGTEVEPFLPVTDSGKDSEPNA